MRKISWRKNKMLKIYTDSSMSSKEYLLDVEAEFDIDEPIIDSMYMESF